MSENDLYTVKEVAEILRLSKFRIYQLLQGGIITGFKVGNGSSWRIARKDLLNYLELVNKKRGIN